MGGMVIGRETALTLVGFFYFNVNSYCYNSRNHSPFWIRFLAQLTCGTTRNVSLCSLSCIVWWKWLQVWWSARDELKNVLRVCQSVRICMLVYFILNLMLIPIITIYCLGRVHYPTCILLPPWCRASPLLSPGQCFELIIWLRWLRRHWFGKDWWLLCSHGKYPFSQRVNYKSHLLLLYIVHYK